MFAVTPQDRMWQGFNRIRMSSARCYLDGIKWTSPSDQPRSVRIVMKTDGRFFDITSEPRNAPLSPISQAELSSASPDTNSFASTSITDLVPTTRTFVGDQRALLFEYEPALGAIIRDGQWGQMQDYTKHTPMTNWEIGIEASEHELAQLDFSELTGIRMEFDCEVIWKGL